MAIKNMSFKLTVVITKQGKRLVAYTPALDISTSGKSEKDVKARFSELAKLFFEEIVEAGTTDDVLSELGWKKVQKKWAPPTVISEKSVSFNIPALA